MNRNIGILLIIIGAVMLIWTGFTYTKKKKIVDMGPLQVSVDQKETIGWPPYVGAILLVGGIVLVVTDKRR
ncbi:MAG: hypothetical protein ACXVB0_14440 [Mucilaginibacter sp.]